MSLILSLDLKGKESHKHTYDAADDGTLIVLVECKANEIDGKQND